MPHPNTYILHSNTYMLHPNTYNDKANTLFLDDGKYQGEDKGDNLKDSTLSILDKVIDSITGGRGKIVG
jgi:hypothetical protein